MTIEFLDEEVSEPAAPTQPSTRRIVFAGEEDVVEEPQRPIGTSFSQEVAQLGPAFMESLGRPLENMGESFEVIGFQGVANALKGAVTEPENYVPASQRFIEPEEGEAKWGFAWQYAPRAAVEQVGQAIGAIGTRIAGAIAGAPLGPAGVATGAFVGPAVFEAAQIIGPIAKERAKNNGRETPNNSDLLGATMTAIGSGALNAVGAKYLPGGEKATGKFFKRVASSFAGEGVTETAQAFTEQVGGTAETEAGLNINAKQAIGEGLIGGTTGAGLSAVTYPFTKDPQRQTIRTPEDAKELDIDAKSNEEAVSLMGQPGDDQNAELRTTVKEIEREIANNETLINGLEPNDPERTRLELQNAEAKKVAARVRGELEQTVGLTPVETEQVRLAREIAAPAVQATTVTPAPVSETITPVGEAAPVTTPAPAEVVTPATEAAPILPKIKTRSNATSFDIAPRSALAPEQQIPRETILANATQVLSGVPEGSIEVVNEPAKEGEFGFVAAYNPNTNKIEINQAYLTNEDNLESKIGHELAHYIYQDPRWKKAFTRLYKKLTPRSRRKLDRFMEVVYSDYEQGDFNEETEIRAFDEFFNDAPDNRNIFQKFIDEILDFITESLANFSPYFNTLARNPYRLARNIAVAAAERFKAGEVIEGVETTIAPRQKRLERAAGPRKPAAEEQPTGPAAESPEGQSVPQAIANGIDIGPEDNMPINRKIDSHLKNFLFLRGFFESASDRLRRNGFTRLGNAIDAYFDGARRRLGDANKIMLAPLEAYEAAPAARKKQIDEDFQTFFAAQENKRDTEAILKQMDPIARRIVKAWQKFGEESGKENQRVGVKVFDPKSQSWRKIGRVEKFWPRRLKPEYQRALMDPDKYAKEYNEIVEALLESGQIKDAKEAEKYLREYSPEATKNDYFSGIEKARGNPLPEKLYDYSMQVMTDYIARWAQHVSRIEQFGQKTTEQSQTLWDREMETTRNPRTRDYIQAARERVEGYFPNDPITKGMAALNIWATGLHLGNPASAMLNMIGGSTLNAMVGQPGALGSYVESIIELRNLGANIRDAKEKGILGRDLMNIVGDHQAILETNKVVQAGQKTADFLLKWSGFTSAEQMIRAQSLIVGKAFVRNTLNAFKADPRGSFARRASAWITRNNFDLDKLIVENGTGPETDRILRYFANISQGSYTIDQVPIFIDTPIGRFLFKYQKFSTQVMRMTWKNTFEPLLKAMTGKGETMQVPDKTRQLIYRLLQEEARSLGDNRRIELSSIPKTVPKAQGRAMAFIPAMMWLGAAYIGGEVLLRMRDMLFGVLMKGPEYEDIIKAFEDDERSEALYLSLERAWYNLIGIGALGLIGNYAQFFLDWQDRERVKNPLEPPALGVFKDFINFAGTVFDQGKLTLGDIDNYASSTLSAYRATKKFAQSIAGFMGLEEIPGVKQEMFRREVNNINKYARRWAEEVGIEYRMTRPTDIAVSERTPVNRKIASYLQSGEPVAAATYAKAYINGLPKDEKNNARQSIFTGARNRQPLRLGSGPMDEAERKAFLGWLKDKVNEERFKEISELDAKYQKDYKTFLSEMRKR